MSPRTARSAGEVGCGDNRRGSTQSSLLFRRSGVAWLGGVWGGGSKRRVLGARQGSVTSEDSDKQFPSSPVIISEPRTEVNIWTAASPLQ